LIGALLLIFGNFSTLTELGVSAMSGLRSWKDSMAPRLSLSDGDLADFNMTPLLCEAPQKALTNQYQEIQITELENGCY
jgi:hypothetical protein